MKGDTEVCRFVHGQFFMLHFSNSDLEYSYSSIFQASGMHFLNVLANNSQYKNLSFTLSHIYLIRVSAHFGNKLMCQNSLILLHKIICNMIVNDFKYSSS